MHRSVIVTKFSKNIQDTLLEKSVFDMLCDFWYFPGISRYIKPLIMPLITGDGPEKTIKSFDNLSPTFKHAVMRKGIVHLFPSWVKKFIQPYESFTHMKEFNFKGIENRSKSNSIDNNRNNNSKYKK